jgi:hypothetical protein
MTMSNIRLNQVECFRRIKNWIANNFTEHIDLEMDENSEGLQSLHFIATTEAGTINVTSRARKAMATELGPAFSLVVTSSQMSIYVLQPTSSDAALLLEKFKRRSSAIMRSVWPLWFATVYFLVAGFFMSYYASLLHEHWKDWHSPYETMFHSIFVIAIWIGDCFNSYYATLL